MTSLDRSLNASKRRAIFQRNPSEACCIPTKRRPDADVDGQLPASTISTARDGGTETLFVFPLSLARLLPIGFIAN